MHERRQWEKDEDHRFSSRDAQRCCGSVIYRDPTFFVTFVQTRPADGVDAL